MSDYQNPSNRFPWARYPALRLALCFALGIVLGPWWQPILGWLLVLLLVLWGATEVKHRRSLHPRWLRGGLLLYLIIVILAGSLRYHLAQRLTPKWMKNVERTMSWEKMGVAGRLRNKKRSSSGRPMLDIRMDSLGLKSGLWHQTNGGIRVYLDSGQVNASKLEKLHKGGRLEMRVKLYPLDGARNPGEFDYRSYLLNHGIQLHGGLERLIGIKTGQHFWSWARWRQPLLDRIKRNFSPSNEALAQAVLLGIKQDLPDRQRRAFTRTGLAHIMAVSGLHVGFLVAPFWFLLPLLRRKYITRWLGLLMLAGLLLVYAGVTGFPASVVRASLMVLFLAAGKLFSRPSEPVNLLGAVALLILAIDPSALFEVGFQLSFSAVLLIMLVWNPLQRMLPDRWRYNWRGKVAGMMGVSLVVQLGLFPLLAWNFSEFSLIGPLANTLLILPLGILIQGCFLVLVISLPWPALGAWLNIPLDYALSVIGHLVKMLSELKFAWIHVKPPGPLIFVLWICIAAILAGWYRPRVRWRSLIAALVVLVLIQLRGLNQSQNRLEVTVLDVGQGDAIVMRTPSNRILLVDTGRWAPGSNAADQVLLPYFEHEGIHKIDALVLTHPHADHIGGAKELLKQMPVDTVYNSGYSYDSEIYQSYLAYSRSNDIPLKHLQAGREIRLDPSVHIETVGPYGSPVGREPNEYSVVLHIRYGQTSFLLTGDAGSPEEHRMLTRYDTLLDIDWLKVGHHGSNSASSADFLKTVTPRMSIVSLGWDNRYGHPDPRAVRRLRNYSDTVWFTSIQHAMRFVSDGRRIRRVEW